MPENGGPLEFRAHGAGSDECDLVRIYRGQDGGGRLLTHPHDAHWLHGILYIRERQPQVLRLLDAEARVPLNLVGPHHRNIFRILDDKDFATSIHEFLFQDSQTTLDLLTERFGGATYPQPLSFERGGESF